MQKNEHITHVHHYHLKLPCSCKKVTDYTFVVCVGEIPEDILENCTTTNIQNDNQTHRTPTNNELLTLKVKCFEKELDISNKKLTKYLDTVSAQTDNGNGNLTMR